MELITPDGSKIISLDWLNNTQILVLTTFKQYMEFSRLNELDLDPNFWRYNNASVDSFLKDGQQMIWINLKRKDRRVIVHEAIHAIHMIFDHRGIPISKENTETIAYTVSYLTEALFNLRKL